MKLRPYVLLFFLALILMFAVGVRYGRHVEQTNKAINYVLSLPPTKPPEPTLSKEFRTFIHKECKVSLLIPNWLILNNQSSTSASFTSNQQVYLSLSCAKTPVLSKHIPPDMVYLEKKNTTGSIVVFFVKKSLVPLIEQTVQFIKSGQ